MGMNKKALWGIVILCVFVFIGSLASAEDLDKIKQAGEMKIALSGTYPPFSFVNDKNEAVGFDPSIGSEIAKRLGVKPVIVTAVWDGILAGLLANKYDTICGSMTITEKRLEVVDFVGPYYRSGRGIFVRKGEKFTKLEDFKERTVGVVLGETHEKWAREQPGWNVRTYKGLTELLLEVENKRVDAIVVDSVVGLLSIKKTGKPIQRMALPQTKGEDVNIGIAIRKGNPNLKNAMQKALDDMMADGTYTKICMDWIGEDIR
jgi:polar amino acid transport system substrate-binding protein